MWRWGLLLLAACGRFGFGDNDHTSDAAVDAPPDASFSTRHWVNRNDGTPGALIGPRLVYDDARGHVLLYGGDFAMATSAAMWELLDSGWSQICNPCAPGPRLLHSLAYDRARDRVVLHGGATGGAIGDMWEWDGATWTQVAPGGPVPGPRDSAQLVYDDTRAASVLVGGGKPTDDQIYDYDGNAWTDRTIGNGPGNVGGYGNEIAYDTRSHLIYVLADTNDNGYRDDLWTWDGSAWNRVCASCTGRPRNDASIIYDVALDRVWLFGGYDGGEIDGTWQLEGGTWQSFSGLPPARDSVSVAYDRARDVIVMYGGNGSGCGGANCAETWEFVPN